MFTNFRNDIISGVCSDELLDRDRETEEDISRTSAEVSSNKLNRIFLMLRLSIIKPIENIFDEPRFFIYRIRLMSQQKLMEGESLIFNISLRGWLKLRTITIALDVH